MLKSDLLWKPPREPVAPVPLPPSEWLRFWSKVLLGDGCWEWTACRERGYGAFGLNGRNVRPHRVAYEYFNGPVPYGLFLDHLCRNRGCVRPDHLEPVTCAENLRRGVGTLVALNVAKTHCPRGHEYTQGKLQRWCRECARTARARRESHDSPTVSRPQRPCSSG